MKPLTKPVKKERKHNIINVPDNGELCIRCGKIISRIKELEQKEKAWKRKFIKAAKQTRYYKEKEDWEEKLRDFRDSIYGENDALFDRAGNNVSRQVENKLLSLLTQAVEEVRRDVKKKIKKLNRDRKDEINCIRNDKHSWEGAKVWESTCFKCGADRFGIIRFNDGYNRALSELFSFLN